MLTRLDICLYCYFVETGSSGSTHAGQDSISSFFWGFGGDDPTTSSSSNSSSQGRSRDARGSV